MIQEGDLFKVVDLRAMDVYGLRTSTPMKINVLVNAGVIEPVVLHQCHICGYQSTNSDDFTLVNAEKPCFGMVDPYPGYGGDMACGQCTGGVKS